jgi:hypothetical protein
MDSVPPTRMGVANESVFSAIFGLFMITISVASPNGSDFQSPLFRGRRWSGWGFFEVIQNQLEVLADSTSASY